MTSMARLHRLLRHDAVAKAMQHQVGHVHARRRLARGVHQVDQPVAHVEPRLAQDLRIVAQLLERLGIVGRLVVDRGRTGGEPRDGVGEEPQAGGHHRTEGVARAQRRCEQDQPVDISTLVLGHQRDGAAHALAGEVERHAGILGAQQRDHRLGIADQGLGAGPAATRRAAAEAALVVGIGRDAVLGPDLRRLVPRLAIVAEAVQAQDHRLGLAGGGGPDGDR